MCVWLNVGACASVCLCMHVGMCAGACVCGGTCALVCVLLDWVLGFIMIFYCYTF